jgi:hypothetical protein
VTRLEESFVDRGEDHQHGYHGNDETVSELGDGHDRVVTVRPIPKRRRGDLRGFGVAPAGTTEMYIRD